MSTLIFLFWHNFVIARLDLENKTQFHMNDNNERERSNKLFNAGFVCKCVHTHAIISLFHGFHEATTLNEILSRVGQARNLPMAATESA